MMPVLFIGHGSPMNMMLDNQFTRRLKKLGTELPRPEAVMVISAHWMTTGTYVNCSDKPRMIYDFFGFPEQLYSFRYNCPGYPVIESIIQTEAHSDCRIGCRNDWGLDHASYSILKYIYPDADIPVFELSLDYRFNSWTPKPVSYHYELGKSIAHLRSKEILIIGSGNIVHNLDLIDFEDMDAVPYDWAADADEKMRRNIANSNHAELIDYTSMGKSACMSVPTLDHYLPMIYAIAMKGNDEEVEFIYEGFQNASISMRSFRIG